LIEYAEATMPNDYGPLMDRVRSDLGMSPLEVGLAVVPSDAAALLTATPVLSDRVTPAVPTDDPTTVAQLTGMPTPTLTSTASITVTAANTPATQITPATVTPGIVSPGDVLTATQTVAMTATPRPSVFFSQAPFFPTRDLVVDYSGTGPFTLGTQQGGLTLYFKPEQALKVSEKRALVFDLLPMDQEETPDIYLLIFRYTRPEQIQTSLGNQLVWGENRVELPAGYLQPDGGFFVRLVNTGILPLAIAELGVRLYQGD
jgi:hypothetical protein